LIKVQLGKNDNFKKLFKKTFQTLTLVSLGVWWWWWMFLVPGKKLFTVPENFENFTGKNSVNSWEL